MSFMQKLYSHHAFFFVRSNIVYHDYVGNSNDSFSAYDEMKLINKHSQYQNIIVSFIKGVPFV